MTLVWSETNRYPIFLYAVVRVACFTVNKKIREKFHPLKTYPNFTIVFLLTKAWWENPWNVIDLFSIIFGWLVLTRDYWPEPRVGTLSAAVSEAFKSDLSLDSQIWVLIPVFFVWLKLIGSLKSTTLPMSTFVTMIETIVSDVREFMVVSSIWFYWHKCLSYLTFVPLFPSLFLHL